MGKKAGKQKEQSPNTTILICEWCGKTKDLTPEEVEKQKKTDQQTKQEGFDYYISCPFCNGGYMFSQEDMVFRDLAVDLFGD